MPSTNCNSRLTILQLGRWTAYPLLISVFSIPSHSITPLFMLWTILGLCFRRFLDAMPRQTTGSMPFSCLPPMSSPLFQIGLKQMGWFSLASHQLTQWHVKQAVTGLAVPSTAILYCHMGIMRTEMTSDRQTVWDTWFDLTTYQKKRYK